MKRTYTPSLESLSRQYGERYFTLKTDDAPAALVFGTLEDIVNTMDATAPDANAATISHAGRALVTMDPTAGPDSAQVLPQPIGETYEIRQVDVWHDGENWTYNETWHLGTFTTRTNVSRAFRRALKRLGVSFIPGRTVTEYDGDIYEIVDRETGAPLFAAIPQA